jgi:RHS repeat-associated protein
LPTTCAVQVSTLIARPGFFYNALGDYDPQTGRYVETDPIGLRGGSDSTYADVAGNPASHFGSTETSRPASKAVLRRQLVLVGCYPHSRAA